jgi:MFS family permease
MALSKLVGLCICVLLCNSAFTVISPFYPAVALRRGVPEWLIGIIFSFFPIASLLLSPFLPALMFALGKTPILILGLFLVAASNILISFLESFSPAVAITASFLSRILSGLGSACSNVSSNAILASDYPENLSKYIAIVQAFGGLGLVAGPSIGSLLYAQDGFQTSCGVFGIVVLVFIPIEILLVGKSRPYVVSDRGETGMVGLAKHPVNDI